MKLFRGIFKNKRRYSAQADEFSRDDVLQPRSGLRVRSEVSLKSVSFKDDCSKTLLNYSIRFLTDG